MQEAQNRIVANERTGVGNLTRLWMLFLLSTFLIASFSHCEPSEADPADAGRKVSDSEDACQVSPVLTVETVFIKGGTFTMGTPITNKRSREYHKDEAPVRVKVNSFRMGKTLVTVEQFCVFLNSPGSAGEYEKRSLYRELAGSPSLIQSDTNRGWAPLEGAGKSPVEVTWLGAVTFCQWLSKRTGKSYRLPTEAEWEFAARGEEGREWPWGGKEDPRRVRSRRMYYDDMRPVGSCAATATPDGVMDMMTYSYPGSEWTVNKWTERLSQEAATDTHADTSDLETPRVVRGAHTRGVSRLRWRDLLRMTTENLPGRPWTRCRIHPFHHTARLRIVEEIPASDG